MHRLKELRLLVCGEGKLRYNKLARSGFRGRTQRKSRRGHAENQFVVELRWAPEALIDRWQPNGLVFAPYDEIVVDMKLPDRRAA